MRITGGFLKSRRFEPPKSFRARPTTEVAREALFNILSNYFDFEECRILDLFAGTGAISLEFASRGALSVTCVEKDFVHYKYIKKLVEDLKLQDVIHPVKGDVFRFLSNMQNLSVSMVFADPPFDLPGSEKIIDLVLATGVLAPEGLLIMEHGPSKDFSAHPRFHSIRKYGKVHFSFFGAFPS